MLAVSESYESLTRGKLLPQEERDHLGRWLRRLPRQGSNEEVLMAFTITGAVPISACGNCQSKDNLGLVPYKEEEKGPMLAVLILCGLCRRALDNGELGCYLDMRVAGQEGWIP